MPQLRISVAMCTYNGAAHLPHQLASICRQTVTPDEIVICDDNSSDETPAMLQRYASETPLSIRVLSNSKRLGSTRNFDRVIHACGGEIIVLADQDDIWKENKLETLRSAFLADADLGYVFSDGDVIDEQGKPIGLSMWESLGFTPSSLAQGFESDATLFLLKQNVVTGAAMAFRSSLVRVFGSIPQGWLHDHWIALMGSIFTKGQPISDRLILYRQHAAQQKGVRRSTVTERYRESIALSENARSTKIQRLKELADRVSEVSNSGISRSNASAAIIQEKIDHISSRSLARSSKGFTKLRVVMSEIAAGRYHRFSDSWISAARDLIA
jgi:glycosyltransferase involved in cell wall biosynthesis